MEFVEKTVISETPPNITNVGWLQPSTRQLKYFINGQWITTEDKDEDAQADWSEGNTQAPSYIKNKPVIDTTPTEDSNNLVTSGGVYAVIGNVESLLAQL